MRVSTNSSPITNGSVFKCNAKGCKASYFVPGKATSYTCACGQVLGAKQMIANVPMAGRQTKPVVLLASHAKKGGKRVVSNLARPTPINWEQKTPYRPSAVFSYCRNSAKRRGLDFKLSLSDFEKLMDPSSKCSYCGACHELTKVRGRLLYDRIDNTKGYTSDNVAISCNTCNRWKGAAPQSRFINRASSIASNALTRLLK